MKVAAVRASYRKVALVGLASVDLLPGVTVVQAVRDAVRQVLGEKGGAGDGVAVALEGSKAAIRTVSLPSSAHKSIADVLPFELEPELPFEVADSVFDYRLLSSRDAEKTAPISVLAVVARISDVRGRIDLVKEALAVEPERVGVGAFSLTNLLPWVPALAGADPVMVVDLGTESSDVLVLEGGEPVFARTLSIGTRGLPATAPKLARELRTTALAHRSQGGTPPRKLFLTGGGAFVSGAEAFLGGELELEVARLPAPALEAERPQAPELEAMPKFAKAVALALGLGPRPMGFNLRRGPLAYERGFGWVKEKIPLLAGLGLAIFVISILSAGAQLFSLSREHKALEGALASVTKEVLGEETLSPGRAAELVALQTQLSDEDPLPHADAFDVMVKLSEDVPPSMVHDVEELDVQKGHVILHGVVGSIPDAQAILTALKSERCFSDAKITRTNQVVGGERQKYVMEFDVKCPEDVKTPKKKDGAAAGSAAASSSAGGK